MDDSRRKVLGSVLGIIIFIICIMSLSYAWYRWRSANTDVDIGIHEGGLKFVYSNNNILESSNLSPILDYKDESYYENNNGSLIYADYTTTNTTNDTYKMIIKLNITELDDALKDSSFKWVLLEKDGSSYSKVIEEGDFSSLIVGSNILNEGIYVPPSSPVGSTSTDYRFVIYIDGNMENSSGMMNSTIKSSLELCDEKVPLYNISLNNQGATNGHEGTAKIYEKYGVGIYKDSTASTTLMTTTANPITVPGRTGYTFSGYYTSTNCSGDQLINNSGYITSKFTSTYTNKDITLYACWKDTTAPTLTLTRTGTVEGFKGWNLTSGASVDSSQILTLASTSAKGTSPFYQVDEQKYEWSYDAYTTAAASEHTPNGGSYTGTNYYDSSFAAKVGSNGYSGNGQTSSIPLNTWKSVKASNYNYGTGIEYFKINMRMSSSWSMPTTKYRNFKVMGDIYAKSKYTINVSSSDSGSGIKVKKYASGSRTASYFKSSGTTFTGNSFNVTANGTYTVYIEDNSGNTTVKTISINKIDNTVPNISSFTSGSSWGQSNTISATVTDSSAGVVSYAFTSSNTEPTSWTTINTNKSAYTATNTVSNNGTYYVWFMDSASNIASKSVNVTKVDKTKPVCTIAKPTSVVYGSTTTVAVSCTDNASMPSQTLSTSSFTTSNNTVAQITAVSAPTAITNGYKYTLTVKGVGVGSYNISMNAGVIKDSAGNTNNKVTSGNGSVTAKNISSTTITLNPTTYVYNGKAKTPTVTVKDGSTTLTKDTHYTVSYSNNTNVGTATATITGKGNYNGTATKTFTITKANSSISLNAKTATYTGSAIAANKATVTGTTGAVTYTYYTNSTCTTQTTTSIGASATGKAPIDAGSYYVKATAAASSNYNAVTSSCVAHTINKKSVGVTWGSTTSFKYDGTAKGPTVDTPVTGVNSEKLNLTRTTATSTGTHTSTASCSSVTGGRAKCANYSLTNNTKSFTITYNTFTITLDNANATSAGTSKLYVRYAEGIYLDSGYTKKMTTTTNPITIPTRTGYTFAGYYDGSIQMIDSTGKITSNFTTTKYSAVKTLTIKWTVNNYTVTFAPNGGVMNSSTSATSYNQNYKTDITMNNPTKVGYDFMGWVSNQRTNVTTAGYWTYTDSVDPLTGEKLEIINSSNHRLNGVAGGTAFTSTPTKVSGTYTPSGYASGTGTNVSYTSIDANPLKNIAADTFYRITRTSAKNNAYSPGPQLNLNYVHRDVNIVYVMVARIPKGWSLGVAANTGGGGSKWLTSTAGTGDWKTYVYSVVSAEVTSYMDTGFFYITNSDSSTNTTHPSLDVAYLQGYYTNKQSATNGVNKFKVGAINETLTAKWRAVDQTVKVTPNSTKGNYKLTASNLFDKNDMITENAKLVQKTAPAWNGISYPTADSTHFISQWIRVIPGATYKISGVSEKGLVEWTSGSKDSAYTASTQATSYSNGIEFKAPTTYTTTSGSTANVTYNYMRFQALTTDKNNITLSMTASSNYSSTTSFIVPNNTNLSITATPSTGYSASMSKSSGLGTFSTSTSGTSVIGNLSSIAGNKTTTNVSVNWTPNSYNIAYNLNGGTKGSSAPTSAKYDADVYINGPTKTVKVTGNANGTGATVGAAVSKAQTFAGWTSSSSAGLSTSTAKVGASANPTTAWTGSATGGPYFKNLRTTSGTVTLTANWTPVALTLPKVTKTGYTCKWNTKAGGSGTSYNSGASYTPSAKSAASVTLYAVCTKNTYTIAYKYNGGTKGSSAPTTGTYDTDVNISNPSKTIKVTGNANGTGATVTSTSGAQTFAGWTSSTSDGLGSNAKVGTSANPTTAWTGSINKGSYFRNLRNTSGTVTLTANWTPKAFNLPTVSKTGYTCKWNTKADGTGTSYDSGESYTPTATTSTSLTMYAICTINSYYFDVNPDSGIASFDVQVGSDAKLTNQTDYWQQKPYGTEGTISNIKLKPGYTYDGHVLNAFFTEVSGSTNESIKVKLGAGNGAIGLNTTPINYTISYNLNGGSNPGNPTTYNPDTASFTLKNPSKTGYTFAGWTGSNGSTPQTTVTIPQFSTGNRSYTANWRRNFTCGAVGSKTTYAGMNWRILSKDSNYCVILADNLSSSTGNYNEATTKLTNEYINKNSTMITEKNAGLLATIKGSSYIDTDGGRNVSNNGQMPGGTYWVGSGLIYDSSARYRYNISKSDTFSGFSSQCVWSVVANPIGISSYVARNAGFNNESNGNNAYYFGGYTTSSIGYGSTTYSSVRVSFAKKNVQVTYNIVNSSGTSGKQNNFDFYTCGGPRHGQIYFRVSQTGKENKYKFQNFYTGESGTRTINDRTYCYAGGGGKSGNIFRFDTGGYCRNLTLYFLSDQAVSYHYRARIKVKYT